MVGISNLAVMGELYYQLSSNCLATLETIDGIDARRRYKPLVKWVERYMGDYDSFLDCIADGIRTIVPTRHAFPHRTQLRDLVFSEDIYTTRPAYRSELLDLVKAWGEEVDYRKNMYDQLYGFYWCKYYKGKRLLNNAANNTCEVGNHWEASSPL